MGPTDSVGYVVCENGCWEWVGAHHGKGYGHIRVAGRVIKAHRYMYELQRGPIPAGLQIDHLCRKRDCVNPDHLEPVTCRTNILRGEGRAANCARKTHCKHGHPLTLDNLVPYYLMRHGQRVCLECHRQRNRERMRRIRANGGPT